VNVEMHLKRGDVTVPTFLYGTAWKEDDTKRCVSDALRAGFRGIDTANQRKHYFEAGVGEALKDAYENESLQREDLFLQTKFTHLSGQDKRLPYDPKADYHTQVMQSCTSSFEHLGTDYLDSYVLHGPSLRVGLSGGDWEVWRAMEELHQAGKVKLLGVSNVAIDQLLELVRDAAVKPHFVQNRCYARMGWDREVRAFCSENDIWYQGFSLLTANSEVLKNQEFVGILTRHNRTAAQVVFRFSMQVGMIPLTGTTSFTHMKEDLLSYNFELDKVEVDRIESISG